MPPKKSRDKTPKKVVPAEKPTPDQVLAEDTRVFYLAQIKDLEERLEKYQCRCDELEVRQKDFATQYSNLEKEKKDIFQYLKRSLARKEDELTDLSEKLASLQEAKESERETFEMQMSHLRLEFQEIKDKLTSENMSLAGKLSSLEEFRIQKEDLMAHLESLKKQLECQKQEHLAAIYNLEKKAVLDKDRLKKEMHQHVAAVAEEFRRVSDEKMPETTMRAIHENASLTAQLRQLSERSEEILKENVELRDRANQLKCEVKVIQPLLNEMTRKSLTNQKVVQQLTQKCQDLIRELEEFKQTRQDHQRLLDEYSNLQSDMELLRQKCASTQEDFEKTKAETERLNTELMAERTLKAQLETVLQEAAQVFKDILKDKPSEEVSEETALAHRSQMMQKILAMMDCSAALGKGQALTELIKGSEHTRERWSLLSSGIKTTKQVSQFRTGDLGLVPRDSQSYRILNLPPQIKTKSPFMK
ncbi:cilia- and flagella-associated protein 157 [Denticeps clupeoides]|uniref:Cilia- and flagella-associated protein 157 n=1 Tax=Denticeps clupeoides TaxID=299321 RepID=A0AAY4ADS1_9TELE|nr:cilia- and flagella-associated protein 157 [Denticeps clupeoides]